MVARDAGHLLGAALLLSLTACASPGRPWTDYRVTLDPDQTLEISAYETRLYRCPLDSDLVLVCSTIGGGGRVGYMRCGCAWHAP